MYVLSSTVSATESLRRSPDVIAGGDVELVILAEVYLPAYVVDVVLVVELDD